MITSTRNPKIQWVRKLQSQARQRRDEGLFVVEGVRLVEEALSAGWSARLVLYSPELSSRGQTLVSIYQDQGAEVEQVSENVLASASETESPQGIMAVIEVQELEFPKPLDFVLVVDALRDPGNLGTVMRTAAAAGAQAVMLMPETVDPFSPKVIRAAMGAHFRLPIRRLDWSALRELVKPDLQVLLAEAREGQTYTTFDLTVPLALIVGGEAVGAGPEAHELADASLHIPMAGVVESLNAAIAASVLMFEVTRQRTLE